jgi:hypothetical protein
MTPAAGRRALLLPLAAAGLALTSCGGPPGTADFAAKAVSFIEGDMARNSQLNGLTFADAECKPPANTANGTVFTCTATGSDGQQRTLTAKIISRNSLQITKLEPGPPERSGGSTTTAAAPTTTAPPAAIGTTVPPGT